MANNQIWSADEYNDSNNSQMIDAKETINQIVKDGMESADIIVDIGCGSGNVTKLLASRIHHKQIYALDFDACMVAYAAQNYNDETIEYFTQDISLPWANLGDRVKQLEGKVDLVWSNRVLHWVLDKAAAVKTMSRLLKPGGRCVVNISSFRDLHEFYSESERKEAETYIKFRPFAFQLAEWQNIFNHSGFSQVTVDTMEKQYVYESTELFKKLLGGEYLKSAHCVIEQTEKTPAFDALSNDEKELLVQKYVNELVRSVCTKFGVKPDVRSSVESKTFYYEQIRFICTKANE